MTELPKVGTELICTQDFYMDAIDGSIGEKAYSKGQTYIVKEADSVSVNIVDDAKDNHGMFIDLWHYFKLKQLTSNTKIISKFYGISPIGITEIVNKLDLADYLLTIEAGSAIFKVPVGEYEAVMEKLESMS